MSEAIFGPELNDLMRAMRGDNSASQSSLSLANVSNRTFGPVQFCGIASMPIISFPMTDSVLQPANSTAEICRSQETF